MFREISSQHEKMNKKKSQRFFVHEKIGASASSVQTVPISGIQHSRFSPKTNMLSYFVSCKNHSWWIFLKRKHHIMDPYNGWKRSRFSSAIFVFRCVLSASGRFFFSTYKPFFAWRLGAIRFGRCMGECHARHLDKCNKTRPTARSERPVVFSFFFNGPAWGTSWVAGWLFPIGGLGSGHPPQLPPKHSGWGIRVICPDEDVWDKLDQSTTYEFAQF